MHIQNTKTCCQIMPNPERPDKQITAPINPNPEHLLKNRVPNNRKSEHPDKEGVPNNRNPGHPVKKSVPNNRLVQSTQLGAICDCMHVASADASWTGSELSLVVYHSGW